MVLKDLIITPIILLVIYIIAFAVRPLVSDIKNRKYFIPGLTLKIVGAISLGLIYQYYYNGGDTFNYFDLGSKYIYDAFYDSPVKGIKLVFANGEFDPATFQYSSNILFYKDLPSYFVVRVAGILDLITFHTYSGTAVLFAVLCFSGLWAMYTGFCKVLPNMYMPFAIAIFFIPSVFFWGSGILKDTLTLGALGWGVFAFINIFLLRRKLVMSIAILLVSFFVIYEIKIYILLCFIPALIIWLYLILFQKMKNLVLKVMVFPFSIVVILLGGYLSIKEIGKENRRYNLERISYTAEATARWLTYVSDREGGSSYSLGDFDYSVQGMAKKFPAAIWVTLFRPYLWEVKNSVMFLSAIESLSFLLLSLFSIYTAIKKGIVRKIFSEPVFVFCLVFVIGFSFAVGVSTYNFGSLVRYKIPMLPFLMIGIFLILSYTKRPRKIVRLAARE